MCRWQIDAVLRPMPTAASLLSFAESRLTSAEMDAPQANALQPAGGQVCTQYDVVWRFLHLLFVQLTAAPLLYVSGMPCNHNLDP
jgi:hypothetical protein